LICCTKIFSGQAIARPLERKKARKLCALQNPSAPH
jgi:hypothetical protein